MADDVEHAAPKRMIPDASGSGSSFWTGGVDGRLLVPFCATCEQWILPLASNCPQCEDELIARPVSGVGSVFTYTVDFHPFNPAVPVPYVIAIIDLVEQQGLRLVSNVVDCPPDLVNIGMEVEVRFERQAHADGTVYVPVFAPRTGGSSAPVPRSVDRRP